MVLCTGIITHSLVGHCQIYMSFRIVAVNCQSPVECINRCICFSLQPQDIAEVIVCLATTKSKSWTSALTSFVTTVSSPTRVIQNRKNALSALPRRIQTWSVTFQ